jgi:hypothetical protein
MSNLTSRILCVLETLTARISDATAFHTKRLDQIEDRLARLDGGHDATEAKLRAYELVNASRRGTGTAPLGFKIT